MGSRSGGRRNQHEKRSLERWEDWEWSVRCVDERAGFVAKLGIGAAAWIRGSQGSKVLESVARAQKGRDSQPPQD